MIRNTPLIDATGLVRDYGALRAVDGVDLRLQRGQVLGLLGPNGAGKTSTMQMICGTLAPTAGHIAIDGVDLLEAPRRARAAIGYLPERPPLYPEMSVAEYLGFVAALHGLPRRARAPTRRRAMERCGLQGMDRRLIGHLSRGYQQRVGLAQAILHDPAAIVLDEPTVGLDPIQIREIRGLIAELGRDHGVILSTHILPEVQSVCSDVAIMDQGRIVFSERVDRLGDSARPDCVLVALDQPPGADALSSIPGVGTAEPAGSGRWRLHFDARRTGPRALAEYAVGHGWGLSELTPERRTLEQVFVAMTTRDSADTEREAS